MKSWKKILLLGMFSLILSLNITTAYAVDEQENYEHNYKLGQFHLIEGQYETAIPFFLEAIEENPSYYEAYMGLANTLLYAQRYEDLIGITTEMIAKFPRSSDAYKLRAQGYNAYNEFVLSQRDLETALDLDPENHTIHVVFGNTYRMMGEFEKAAAAYTNGLRDAESREHTYILLGEAYELNKEYDKAMLNFRKSLDMNPNSYMAHLKIAYIYTVTGDYDNGIKYYNLAVKIQPSQDLHIQVGVNYVLKEDIPSSVIAFERAIAMDETDVDLMQSIASTFKEYNEFSLAEKYLDRGLEIEPNNANLLNEYGIVKLRQSAYEEALNYFNSAFEFDSESKYIVGNLGTVYNRLGNLDLAYQYLGDSIIMDSEYEYSMDILKKITVEQKDVSGFKAVVERLENEDKASAMLYQKFVHALIQNEQYAEAKAEGIRSSDIQKDYIHALNIGSHFEEAGKTAEAQYFYDLAKTYGTYTVDELRNFGYVFAMNGMWRQRVQCEMHALELEPENFELMVSIGLSLYANEDLDAAYEMFEKAAEQDETSHYPYIVMGEISYKSGNIKTAIDNYRKVFEIKPDFGADLIEVLKIFNIDVSAIRTADGRIIESTSYNSDQYAMALEYAANAFKENEMYDQAVEFYYYAIAYGSETALNELIDCYEKMEDVEGLGNISKYLDDVGVMNHSSVQVEALYKTIAALSDKLEDYDKAIAYYEKYVALVNDDSVAFEKLGYLYCFEKEDYDSAEIKYLKSIELDPINYDSHLSLSLIYYSKGNYELVIKHADIAMEGMSSFPYIYHFKGLAYKELEEYNESIESLKQAIALGSDSYEDLAYCYYMLEDYESALINFNLSLKQNPNNSYANRMVGKTLRWLGRYAESAAYFEKAIELYPSSYDSYTELGMYYETYGDYDKSELMYKKALEIEPNYAFAHIRLSGLYVERAQYDLAYDHAQLSVGLDPSDHYTFHYLGKVQAVLGNVEESKETYKKALELVKTNLSNDPSDVQTKSDVAYYSYRSGHEESSFELFEEYLAVDPNDFNLNYDYACVLAMSGNLDESFKYFEATLNNMPIWYVSRHFEDDEDLNNLKSDPRFNQLLDKYFN